MSALHFALGLGAERRHCFPCRVDKTPACPHGFKEATAVPAEMRELWRRYPGPLVGVATGELSGVDVLDLDKKHDSAVHWWAENRHRLPTTRTHRTKSGGLHLVFRHAPGLRCWTARPLGGIDGRAGGGYVIWWPAAGLPVLCRAAPADWPEWLLAEVTPRPAAGLVSAVSQVSPVHGYRYIDAAFRSAVERIERAGEGIRNHTLNNEAHGLARFVAQGVLDAQQVADALAAAAISAGLHPREVVLTLRSAFRARGVVA